MKEKHTGDHATESLLYALIVLLLVLAVRDYTDNATTIQLVLSAALLLAVVVLCGAVYWLFFSQAAKKDRERSEKVYAIPDLLKQPDPASVYIGQESALKIPLFLPNKVRSRHVHILGATGSGKTESVLYSFIAQDTAKNHPVVIVDAKGDLSFLNFLRSLPHASDRLQIFDVSSENSPCTYNPLASGSFLEAGQRLFNSLIWSEPYFKIKARAALLRACTINGGTRSLSVLLENINSPNKLAKVIGADAANKDIVNNEFRDLSGLIAQLQQLTTGHIAKVLTDSNAINSIDIAEGIKNKKIMYFRLPALLDHETSRIIGRLIISDLAFYASKAQESDGERPFCPVFLDEFGSLTCEAFLELIAKARSAGLALHFSHQSVGDIAVEGPTYLNRVLDNSSTKIVMRVYDPDTADFMARAFGTVTDTKLTHQVEVDAASATEKMGMASMREVQVFRASPDDMKQLPTGQAFMFLAHALKENESATCVFKVQFPKYQPTL